MERRSTHFSRYAVVGTALSYAVLGLCIAVNAFGGPLAVEGMNPGPSVVWSLAAVLGGVGVLLVPWERWWPWSFLVLVLGSIPLLLIINHSTGYIDSPLGVGVQVSEFFMLLALAGMALPRGMVTLCAGVMMVAYVGTTAIAGDDHVLIISQVLTIPIAAFVGEVIAWLVQGLAGAREVEHQHVEDLEALSRSMGRLRTPMEFSRAIELVPEILTELFRADHADLTAQPDPSDPSDPTATDVRLVAGSSTDFTVPLIGATGPLALVTVHLGRDADAFTMRLAQLFADEAGPELEQIRQMTELAQEATEDELTGIGNRRQAERLLTTLRHGDAVLLIDLDGLKPINDARGHAAGDDLLRGFASFLQREVRDADLVTRFGGDEFLLIVRRTSDEDAGHVADRLRERWAETEPLSTVSIGVAAHDDTLSSTITVARADKALYVAKANGGDQATSFHEPEVRESTSGTSS